MPPDVKDRIGLRLRTTVSAHSDRFKQSRYPFILSEFPPCDVNRRDLDVRFTSCPAVSVRPFGGQVSALLRRSRVAQRSTVLDPERPFGVGPKVCAPDCGRRRKADCCAETGLPRTSGGLPLPVTDTQVRHRIVHSKRGLTKSREIVFIAKFYVIQATSADPATHNAG